MGWHRVHQGSAADHLEELCRRATQKTLERPDLEANEEVVQFINSKKVEKQEMFDVFLRRLEQKTAQKVWLAMVLIKQVLADCPGVEAIRTELVSAVSKVAAQPMDRYSPTLPAQQRLKSAGYDIVRAQDAAASSPQARSPSKREGQHASPRKLSGELGASPKRAPRAASGELQPGSVEMSPVGGARPRVKFSFEEARGSPHKGEPLGEARGSDWGPVCKRLRTDVDRAKLYISHLQEVVLGYSSRDPGAPQPEGEVALLEHSVARLRAFRAHLRASVAEASTFTNPEAQPLLAEALAVTETLNNSMELYGTDATLLVHAKGGDWCKPEANAPKQVVTARTDALEHGKEAKGEGKAGAESPHGKAAEKENGAAANGVAAPGRREGGAGSPKGDGTPKGAAPSLLDA